MTLSLGIVAKTAVVATADATARPGSAIARLIQDVLIAWYLPVRCVEAGTRLTRSASSPVLPVGACVFRAAKREKIVEGRVESRTRARTQKGQGRSAVCATLCRQGDSMSSATIELLDRAYGAERDLEGRPRRGVLRARASSPSASVQVVRDSVRAGQ